MTKGSALVLAVGVVTVAALGAVLLAKRSARPGFAGGAPPPAPSAPGTVGVGGNAPAGKSGYGKTDAVADLLTGGAYSSTKFSIEHPGDTIKILTSFF